MLEEMGIEDEAISKIVKANYESIEALKNERDAYRAEAEKVPGLEKKIEEAGEKTKKVVKEFEDFKAEVAGKETLAAKEKAYREILAEAGISDKRISAILRVTDLDGIEIEDGKAKDHDNLVAKARDEWPEFVVTEETKGAEVKEPPKEEKDDNEDGMARMRKAMGLPPEEEGNDQK